ncbi:MAG: carbamate kinase [Clostridiales bacterium]|nr:carbamate kinase [Clostridiales bacterium]
MNRIVVALGGNAILTDDASAIAQQKALADTSLHLIELIKQGYEVIISHGNGPQVGNLLIQQHNDASEKNPAMPLNTCVAMTQGSIGYWMQQAIMNAIAKAGLNHPVASIVTQVEVDPDDISFRNPSKPIGPFFDEEQAKIKSLEENCIYKEDSGRGWRKVVPSPKPLSILEVEAIKTLADSGFVTVCSGGGGIPVVRSENGYEGVEAVIDKDFASGKLAELLDAKQLIILTGVDNVYINFNKPDQMKLERIHISEIEALVAQNHFAPGSMLPKVLAAITFVKSGINKEAIITSLEQLKNIGHGAGTVIYG